MTNIDDGTDNGAHEASARSQTTMASSDNLRLATAAPADDPEPPKAIRDSALAQAKSEAFKPLIAPAEDLYSNDPAKAAARKALNAAYAKAASAGGELKAKYEAAEARFMRAATDMAQGDPSSRLDKWTAKWIPKDGDASKPSLTTLFQDQAQVLARYDCRLGRREKKRDETIAKAKRWQKAYEDWSKPVDTIKSLIGEYADQIDKLNADINTDKNADLAIYQFWFEVAPKHLQLRSSPADAAIAKLVNKLLDALKGALGDAHPFIDYWKTGSERTDGSIYLLDVVTPLTDQREKVFEAWKSAAEIRADAEVDFKLRPDDVASLKTRRDAFDKDRAAAVKALLQDPNP